ncbi:hypothetical protein H6G76_31865 [Nostoc sp. FACHB-152]|nr:MULTISPECIES: hypothetical protein [unclassified Nostoc]MBD2451637.1 hypothetical protein [Nostoc sp. FACHB-152]MBD2472701.1 hypothetical protein [Nostoc sp. FACHB-145]
MASDSEICPIFASNKDFSRLSSRDKRTVEGTRKPLTDQSLSVTSVCVRGLVDVTTAATTSSPSNYKTSTGRFLEPSWLVNGISAPQNSPA